MHEEAVVCVKCGVQKGVGNKFCDKCGAQTHPDAVVCINCGCSFNTSISNDTQKSITQPTLNQKSKLIAGLLGIFLGIFGAHNFYLGHNTKAIVQLCLTLIGSTFTCGITAIVAGIWGLIEGIQILSGNIKTDADGNPLKND
jgi:TM2 domain-containing membrane protein YozV/ribosomal protein L40E